MNPPNYVFSSRNTKRYRFPTHTNHLVMDRSESETAEAFIVILESGEAPPLHAHGDCEQLFYILEGQGRLQIGQEDPQYYSVSPGDVVRIPQDVRHRIRCEGEARLVYLSIDCFVGGRPAVEPTWESHVHVVCKANGWDFDAVVAP